LSPMCCNCTCRTPHAHAVLAASTATDTLLRQVWLPSEFGLARNFVKLIIPSCGPAPLTHWTAHPVQPIPPGSVLCLPWLQHCENAVQAVAWTLSLCQVCIQDHLVKACHKLRCIWSGAWGLDQRQSTAGVFWPFAICTTPMRFWYLSYQVSSCSHILKYACTCACSPRHPTNRASPPKVAHTPGQFLRQTSSLSPQVTMVTHSFGRAVAEDP